MQAMTARDQFKQELSGAPHYVPGGSLPHSPLQTPQKRRIISRIRAVFAQYYSLDTPIFHLKYQGSLL
jgi:hypothetical protein